MKNLKDVLQIEKGVTAFIGAGGKTSALLQVAKELSEMKKKVLVTTTTKMFALKENEVRQVVLGYQIEKIIKALEEHDIVGVGDKVVQGKMIGVDKQWIQELKEIADYVLVEADGSRRLPLKVPGEHEPVIPECTERVIIVVGWSGVGQPIGEGCFRADRVATLVDKDERAIFERDDLITILTKEGGLRKGVEHRKVYTLINQVDTMEDEQQVKYIVDQLKQKNIDAIVVAALEHKKWLKI